MLFRRPCYYDKFSCTADKCTDNCCIGWEICIDEDTCDYYKSVGGTFGERLKQSISDEEEPSFILKDERCPFLNKNNLCDIITTLGENALCQICRDHPRWFEWYGNEKEGGIGLSCEEGARLILSEEGFADYFESECEDLPDEDSDEEAYRFLLSVREEIFDILCETALPLEQRLNKILRLAERAQAALGGEKKETAFFFSFEEEIKRAVPILEKTEPIDEKWIKEAEGLKKADLSPAEPDEEEAKYIERLFAYFVWRYFLKGVFDYRVAEKIRFALFSVTVIFALYKSKGEKSFDAIIKSAVLYSKQMEYSEENLDIFFLNC